MIVLRGNMVPGTCNIEPAIERVLDQPEVISRWAPVVGEYEKLLANEETHCGACKMSEWGKRFLALPEVQNTTRLKQLLQLYQREMAQKCSGMPDTMTLALYAAGGLAALAAVLFIFKK